MNRNYYQNQCIKQGTACLQTVHIVERNLHPFIFFKLRNCLNLMSVLNVLLSLLLSIIMLMIIIICFIIIILDLLYNLER